MGILIRGGCRDSPRAGSLSDHRAKASGGALRRSSLHRSVKIELQGADDMQSLRLGFMLAVVLTAAGCAHQMTMRADVAGLGFAAGAPPIPKNIGPYISPANAPKDGMTAESLA